jgi:hypothetical protein
MNARCLAIVAICAAGTASADTVNLSYAGTGNGRMLHIWLGAQERDTFAGRLLHDATGGTGSLAGLPATAVTFCVDLLQNQATSPSAYTLSSVATLSGNAGRTNLGYAKQQAIYDIYAAAAGRQFTLGLDYATAFQVALWEIVYDYNPSAPGYGLSNSGGTFRAAMAGQTALSPSIADKVSFLLGSVGLNAAAPTGLKGLRSAGFQDQLFDFGATVPLPRGIWIGLATLSGIGLTRRCRRTTAGA